MKNISIVLIIICSCLIYTYSFVCSQKKEFVYKKSSYIQKDFLNIKKQEHELLKLAIDLTNYLPDNYVTDASIDYTTFIQKGFDENKIVKMPNFQILINKKGLNLKSHSRIIFQKNSSLIMSPNSLANYSILEINNVDDVILYSPVIIGERNKHFGEKGEWGMGVNILSAKNIQIFNLKVSNCWGDGIYIGGGSYGSSENIKINNAVIDFCRRNGISITDGDSIEIVNTIISNTQGTLPMCGVDIEPNDNNAIINKILIKNLLTFNNSNSGILIFLNQLQGNLKKKVDINIENHRDYNSDIGFMLGGYDQQNSIHQSFPGSINITNPQWINNQISIKCGDNLSKGPKVIFKNIKIKNNKETPKEVKNKLIKTENVVVVE